MTLRLCVNGKEHELDVDPTTPLAFVLRNDLGLKGTKIGCGLEQCGACAVLVDGKVQLSCVTEAAAFEGRDIVTIEGISARPTGARVQDAFVAETAAQCGYCTAGLVVAATALLETEPRPDRKTTFEALDGHICRCGSHPRVLAAVARAAKVP